MKEKKVCKRGAWMENKKTEFKLFYCSLFNVGTEGEM